MGQRGPQSAQRHDSWPNTNMIADQTICFCAKVRTLRANTQPGGSLHRDSISKSQQLSVTTRCQRQAFRHTVQLAKSSDVTGIAKLLIHHVVLIALVFVGHGACEYSIVRSSYSLCWPGVTMLDLGRLLSTNLLPSSKIG